MYFFIMILIKSFRKENNLFFCLSKQENELQDENIYKIIFTKPKPNGPAISSTLF